MCGCQESQAGTYSTNLKREATQIDSERYYFKTLRLWESSAIGSEANDDDEGSDT